MDKIDKVIGYAQSKLIYEVAAHDFSHSERVKKLAEYIAKNSIENVDFEIIRVASLTHDIIDKKVAPNIDKAIEELQEFLISIAYNKEQVIQVLDIIQNMSYSTGRIPNTLEGKIVQDADRLEAIGAIAIARTFAYGGSLGRPIYQEGNDNCGIAHFYQKLLLLKDMMNTDIGKQLALERHEFMEIYLKQFYKEWDFEV
jgi:uncharacterized protein